MLETNDLWLQNNPVCKVVGECFKYYKGNVYKVVGVALNVEQDIPTPNLLYQRFEDQKLFGPVWSQSYASFMKLVFIEGELIPRYKHLTTNYKECDPKVTINLF